VTEAPPDTEALLTIDELAARTGMTVRTVRFYAAKGLLPVPIRRGRVGYYGPIHRTRLDLVRELQDHGYALAGIERHLSRIPIDATVDELALYRARLVPWEPERAEDFGREELERRAGQALSDEDLDLLIEIGVLDEPAGDHFRATPSMLTFGVELLAVPVPRQILREAAAVIDRHATSVAAALTDVFRRGVWEPFQRGELAGTDAEQLAAAMARLRPLTVQGLVVAFERAADRAVRNPDEGEVR
jgi:DNA-binding transcriptional MerR regulator